MNRPRSGAEFASGRERQRAVANVERGAAQGPALDPESPPEAPRGLPRHGDLRAAGYDRDVSARVEWPQPLDMFRAYFAVYAREQAFCHFSPALISNLERYWNAQNRKP